MMAVKISPEVGCMQVLLRGGQITREVDARTTHLVVLPPPEAGELHLLTWWFHKLQGNSSQHVIGCCQILLLLSKRPRIHTLAPATCLCVFGMHDCTRSCV